MIFKRMFYKLQFRSLKFIHQVNDFQPELFNLQLIN
ncbi:hypothetical protein EVA_08662 [gut metagenome]|uniref:Uncharacterized protein n=1 Tax=gut metagenome TaxID=749906 RepID=J9CSR1_9ZZZZ